MVHAQMGLLQQTSTDFRGSIFDSSFCAKNQLEAGIMVGIKKICLICNNQFEVKVSREKTAKYCSQKCYIKSRIGNPRSEEFKRKFSLNQIGSKNPNWKGDSVGYSGLHLWIRRNKPKPEFCEHCKKVPPYDLANISQKYKRDVNDYEWLCRSCHINGDGRLENMNRIRLSKNE